MKSMLKTVILGIAGVALVVVPASAQMNLTGSAYLGFTKMMEEDAPDGSFGGRVNGFAMVHPAIGIGAEVGHLGLGSFEFGADEVSISSWQFTPSVMARGIAGPVRPYAIGGAGAYLLRVSETLSGTTTSSTETKFGFNLGGGLNFKPTPAGIVSFGIEGRYHVVPGIDDGDTGETTSLDVLSISGGIFIN